MDNNKKLAENLLKADGINPAGVTESERIAFGKILDRQLETKQLKQAYWPDKWIVIIKNSVIKFAAIIIVVSALYSKYSFLYSILRQYIK